MKIRFTFIAFIEITSSFCSWTWDTPALKPSGSYMHVHFLHSPLFPVLDNGYFLRSYTCVNGKDISSRVMSRLVHIVNAKRPVSYFIIKNVFLKPALRTPVKTEPLVKSQTALTNACANFGISEKTAKFTQVKLIRCDFAPSFVYWKNICYEGQLSYSIIFSFLYKYFKVPGFCG